MSAVSYDVFLSEVMPYVHDVPELVAIQAVRNACIEFCEETRYLQVDSDAQTAVAGQADYDLEADTGYVCCDLVEAWAGDQLLIPKSVEEITKIYRANDWRQMTGNPYYYFRTTSQVVTLVPKPSTTEAAKLKFRIAIAPSRASTTVDSEMFERFLEQIAYGARARLYNTPGQPYYDPKTAEIYLKRFNDAIAEVRTRVNKGLSRASIAIEFQRFA